MPSPIEYKRGEKVGNCIYINETTPVADKSGHTRRAAIFKCDCGNLFEAKIEAVKAKVANGCYECKCKRLSKAKTKHGFAIAGKRRDEHGIWCGIISRCTQPNNHAYAKYGGADRNVCQRWQDDFMNFYEDMGDRPSKFHSVERVNNDLGYFKENCIWATRKQQARNRSSNLLVEYMGQTKILIEWTEELGIPYQLAYARIKRNWPPAKAFQQKNN